MDTPPPDAFGQKPIQSEQVPILEEWQSEVRRIKEPFVSKKNGERITKASTVAKLKLPSLSACRGYNFDLAEVDFTLFDRSSAKQHGHRGRKRIRLVVEL